jgi:hypothetical protein
MSLTEDTILQREVVSRTAQKRAPITAHGSSGCSTDKNFQNLKRTSYGESEMKNLRPKKPGVHAGLRKRIEKI